MQNINSMVNVSADFDEAVHQIYIPDGALEFNPNFGGDRVTELNCYSYALGLDKHGWAFPGQLLYEELKKLDKETKKVSMKCYCMMDLYIFQKVGAILMKTMLLRLL